MVRNYCSIFIISYPILPLFNKSKHDLYQPSRPGQNVNVYLKYLPKQFTYSISGMTNICLYLYLLLTVADGSYFSRIGNMYHGVYLNETLQPSTRPTYWIFRDSMTILTPDANYQLCINVTKHLHLCNDTQGKLQCVIFRATS